MTVRKDQFEKQVGQIISSHAMDVEHRPLEGAQHLLLGALEELEAPRRAIVGDVRCRLTTNYAASPMLFGTN